MANLNKAATLGRAKREFGCLSDEALELYWRALQNHNKVDLIRGQNAHGLDQLLTAKMATTSKRRGGVIVMVLTFKAKSWAVPAAAVVEIV